VAPDEAALVVVLLLELELLAAGAALDDVELELLLLPHAAISNAAKSVVSAAASRRSPGCDGDLRGRFGVRVIGGVPSSWFSDFPGSAMRRRLSGGRLSPDDPACGVDKG
jgi:hypothetical protein